MWILTLTNELLLNISRYKKRVAKMDISNCLFSPTLEILRDFQHGVYLQSLVLTHATTHSRDR